MSNAPYETPSSISGCVNRNDPTFRVGAIPIDPSWYPSTAKVNMVLKQFRITNLTPGREVIVCAVLIQYHMVGNFEVFDAVTQGDYRFSTAPCIGTNGKTGTFWADLPTEAVNLEPNGHYLLALESLVNCLDPSSGPDPVPCPPDPPGQSVGSYGAVVAQINW